MQRKYRSRDCRSASADADSSTGSIGAASGTPRHSGGTNIVFADSHAKFISANKMTGSYGTGTNATGGFYEYPVVNPLNIPPP